VRLPVSSTKSPKAALLLDLAVREEDPVAEFDYAILVVDTSPPSAARFRSGNGNSTASCRRHLRGCTRRHTRSAATPRCRATPPAPRAWPPAPGSFREFHTVRPAPTETSSRQTTDHRWYSNNRADRPERIRRAQCNDGPVRIVIAPRTAIALPCMTDTPLERLERGIFQLVDPRRFELLTSSMRTRRATNCAKGPQCVATLSLSHWAFRIEPGS
jgi:hypothetical protein